MTNDEIEAWAIEHCRRTRAAQNLPECVENTATLARLADALKRSRELAEVDDAA